MSGDQPPGEPKPQSAIHRVLAEVVGSERLPGDHHRLVLRAPIIAQQAAPGQFLHIWCHPPGEIDRPPCAAVLRRPYSISRLRGERRLPPPDIIEVLLRVRGVGGRMLADKSPGNQLDLLGPLGSGFRYDPSLRTVVVIAGGSGLAPVPFIVEHLVGRGARVVCLAGAKSDEAIPFRVERPRAGRATLPEIEALGAEVTFVSEAIESLLISQVVELRLGEFDEHATGMLAIGPRAMLKRLNEVTDAHLPLQVSLEERMACGVGACRSCVVPVRSDDGPSYKTVCRDGPVFDASEIAWELLEA